MGIHKFVDIGCMHVPHNDLAATAIMLQFVQDFRPSIRILLGDFLDLEQVSSHPNEEESPWDRAMLEANYILDELEPTHLYKGNHEDRITRPGNIKKSQRPAFDLDAWLHLKKRGVEVVPYSNRGVIWTGEVAHIHGFGKGGATMGRKAAIAYGRVIHAHTHVQSVTHVDTYDGAVAYGTGCLLSLNPEYTKTWELRNWQNGFVFGYWNDRTGKCSVYQARIENGEAVIEGKEYSAP